MADFEGHTPYMTTEPSAQPFASRHSMTSAEGKGALPTGHAVFKKAGRPAAKTTNAFLKKIGD